MASFAAPSGPALPGERLGIDLPHHHLPRVAAVSQGPHAYRPHQPTHARVLRGAWLPPAPSGERGSPELPSGVSKALRELGAWAVH